MRLDLPKLMSGKSNVMLGVHFMGRFEEALEAAQWAARLDQGNKEVSSVAKRARAVAVARARGNELFKASRFSEACVAYGEGLEHDPYNSVLLCNRAACRVRLNQLEKAIEDCTAALNLRPGYNKGRLRRADCYAKVDPLSFLFLFIRWRSLRFFSPSRVLYYLKYGTIELYPSVDSMIGRFYSTK